MIHYQLFDPLGKTWDTRTSQVFHIILELTKEYNHEMHVMEFHGDEKPVLTCKVWPKDHTPVSESGPKDPPPPSKDIDLDELISIVF
jgi:hypothetical protein